jgi:hypothetical protein
LTNQQAYRQSAWPINRLTGNQPGQSTGLQAISLANQQAYRQSAWPINRLTGNQPGQSTGLQAISLANQQAYRQSAWPINRLTGNQHIIDIHDDTIINSKILLGLKPQIPSMHEC